MHITAEQLIVERRADAPLGLFILLLFHGAEAPEDFLHVRRDRRGECHLLPCPRMRKGEPVGVEGLAVELFHRLPKHQVSNGPGPALPSVKGITQNGMADPG